MNFALKTISACILLGAAVASAHADEMMSDQDLQDNKAMKQPVIDQPAKKNTSQISKDEATSSSEESEEPKTWIDNLSATATITSNYMFRGTSQTENLPAEQASFTYTFPIGFYLNVWGSNVKFPGSDATVELDTVGGWSGEYHDLAMNFWAGRYNYPRARDLNYNEANAIFNYSFLQLMLSYTANAYNTHRTGSYYNIGINYDVPSNYTMGVENVNFQALYGHSSLPRDAGDSYNDYLISIAKTLSYYTLALQWTGTNGRQHNSPYDDNQINASLTAEIG